MLHKNSRKNFANGGTYPFSLKNIYGDDFLFTKRFMPASGSVKPFAGIISIWSHKVGGEEGIRTLVGLLPNGFQDRLVMTASISLRIFNCKTIIHKNIRRYGDASLCPVTVPEIFCSVQARSQNFDRCHSSRFLNPPTAAVAFVPAWISIRIILFK